MQIITGTITSVSPVHIGNGRTRGTFSQTLPYIPGRTIRGMVGWYLYQFKRSLFDACGLSEDHDSSKMKVFFRYAYPFADGKRAIYAPLILHWCKGCQSMIPPDTRECEQVHEGSLCLQEGRKHTGLISYRSFAEKRLIFPDSVPLRIETKCPITRDGHTSMGKDWELKPYHIQSIEPGVSFGFSFLADESVADGITACLQEASYACGLGGFRSRGYGLVDFSLNTPISVDDMIQNRAQELSGMDSFLLTLNAPCIFRSENESHLGFDRHFFTAVNERLSMAGYTGDISPADGSSAMSRTLVRGWSLKNGNMVDEIIPALGPGSCTYVSGSPVSLAALEVLGAGDLLSMGCGEMYIGGI